MGVIKSRLFFYLVGRPTLNVSSDQQAIIPLVELVFSIMRFGWL